MRLKYGESGISGAEWNKLTRDLNLRNRTLVLPTNAGSIAKIKDAMHKLDFQCKAEFRIKS